MKYLPLPRLDDHPRLREHLQRYCRLTQGEIWLDPVGGHRVACLDAASRTDVDRLMSGERAILAVHDPPYNQIAFDRRSLLEFIEWAGRWVSNTDLALGPDSALYVWMGADQRNGFQPLPDFMLMMRDTPFQSRSFITLRNQRGYGTQHNWMAVRQELLYYTKGVPGFHVSAEYTDIPKILRGYYKDIAGQRTENLERSKASTIRAGNVWVDIQQVFYRMEENVSGCYAQKPLRACERILESSSAPGELVLDLFSHSGSTILAAERLSRRCFAADIDPIFCEITIRRLERYRSLGVLGWQASNPFEAEFVADSELRELLRDATRTVASVQPSLF